MEVQPESRIYESAIGLPDETEKSSALFSIATPAVEEFLGFFSSF